MTLLLISSELECNVLKCTEQCPHDNNVYCDTNLIGYQSETERSLRFVMEAAKWEFNQEIVCKTFPKFGKLDIFNIYHWLSQWMNLLSSG